MATLYAGTSGFAYPAWKPGFYPAKTPANQFLKHYATRLNCVEINYTFRRLPSGSTLQNWVEQTPAGLVFAAKATRALNPAYTAGDVQGFAARSKELLATGRDLYLMFKHEESPEGALNAEAVLRSF